MDSLMDLFFLGGGEVELTIFLNNADLLFWLILIMISVRELFFGGAS